MAGRLNNGVSGLLKKNKVAVIWGEVRLEKPGEVTVGEIVEVAGLAGVAGAARRAGRGDLSR